MHQHHSARSWYGLLEIDAQNIDFRTRLTRIRHTGPLRVQRPFYPAEDGQCHAYLLHPPGGMACGDTLDFKINCANQSHLLVTTPAAGKIYGNKGLEGVQKQNIFLKVGEDAILEWLPQETIVFDTSHLEQHTEIHLDKSASLIAMDIQCLGRRLSGESFLTGSIKLNLKLKVNEQLFHQERLNAFPSKENEIFKSDAGFQNKSVTGTLLMYNQSFETEQKLDDLWQQLESYCSKDSLVSITRKGALIIARYLGDKPEEARNLLTLCRNAAIESITGNTAIEPRIWNT